MYGETFKDNSLKSKANRGVKPPLFKDIKINDTEKETLIYASGSSGSRGGGEVGGCKGC